MILDVFEGQFMFEQDEAVDQTDQTPEEDQSVPGDPPEFIHLKKYYLLERLRDLKSRLDSRSVSNNELETILQFGNEFSYDTLVRLATDILDITKMHLIKISREVKPDDRKEKTESV